MSNSIVETSDGSHTILSDTFGVNYHSKYGAIQETQHVFIQSALQQKALEQANIAVLDIGFGTGLNALMTCLEATNRNLNVTYVGVEAFPITLEMAKNLNFTAVLNESATTNDVFIKMHEATWNTPIQLTEHFNFTKLNQRFQDLAFTNQFDIIYFDAFAPSSQPELWETPVMQIMYNALVENGILTTYCAKGVVKRTMKGVGFQIERLPGPPGKREMTRATKIMDS